MIKIGDKFRYHWVEHEECYKECLYQVIGLLDGCTCGKPTFITGKPEVSRRPHLHIRAKLIDAPVKSIIDKRDFWFGPLDSETLYDIEDPDKSWIEIVRQKGDQLSLF